MYLRCSVISRFYHGLDREGQQVDEVLDKLWDYWILAKDSKTFSDDEIIGNIVISAMLYSGLNQKRL